jgi:hypothetical protein
VPVPEVRICFTEDEVAQILWSLAEAIEMAERLDALSPLVQTKSPSL